MRLSRNTIEPGDKFYGYKVSRAVKLMRGWFANDGFPRVRIEAFGERLQNDQVRLLIEVEKGEPTLVSEILFEGNKRISSADMRQSLINCLSKRRKIYEERFYEYCLDSVRKSLLYKMGYINSSFGPIRKEIKMKKYVLTIPVKEGALFRLGTIEIKGTRAFTEKKLLDKLGLSRGAVADGARLQEFVYKDLKKMYGNIGYVEYDVDFLPTLIDPKTEKADGIVNVKIIVEEGVQYEIGGIEFLGVENASKEKLRQLLGLKKGNIFSQTELEMGLKRIDSLKMYRPIDLDLDIETRVVELPQIDKKTKRSLKPRLILRTNEPIKPPKLNLTIFMKEPRR